MTEVRVDKWLWAARLFGTRALAQDACDGGHVQCDDAPLKPSKPVRPGMVLRVDTAGGRRIVRVVALADKRGPAAVARTLFDDLTPPAPPRAPPLALRERGEGRPTKRDRRRIDWLRGD